MKRRTDLSWAGRSASWAAVKYVALDNTRLLLIYEPVGFTINYILLCMQIHNGEEICCTYQLLQSVFITKEKKSGDCSSSPASLGIMAILDVPVPLYVLCM